MLFDTKYANESISRQYYNLRFTFSLVFILLFWIFFPTRATKNTHAYCYRNYFVRVEFTRTYQRPHKRKRVRRRSPSLSVYSARIAHVPKSRGTCTTRSRIESSAVIAFCRKPTANTGTYPSRCIVSDFVSFPTLVLLLNSNSPHTARRARKLLTDETYTRCRFLVVYCTHLTVFRCARTATTFSLYAI